jgi:hypothetical protein
MADDRPRQLKSRLHQPATPKPGMCLICLDHTKDMVGDHCHQSGASRDWICRRCNTGLGMFRDNPNTLERAASNTQDFTHADPQQSPHGEDMSLLLTNMPISRRGAGHFWPARRLANGNAINPSVNHKLGMETQPG